MMTESGLKQCTKCKEDKPFSEFYAQATGRMGLTPNCKDCLRAKSKTYRSDNPGKVRATIAAWSLANPEKVKGYSASYYADNADAVKARAAEWRRLNPGRQEQAKAARKEADPGKVREQTRRRVARRLATPKGKVENSVRTLIHRWIARGSKSGRSTFEILGYTSDELRLHLERQFAPGMSWENYGPVWHIDHIRPLASFNYDTPHCDEFRAAWAITNLRPLWAKDNISKGAKVSLLV